MVYSKENSIQFCDVCGATEKSLALKTSHFSCSFCGFEKDYAQKPSSNSDILIFSDDINSFFKEKFKTLNSGETFDLTLPVSRFYKSPKPIPGQVNFFKSKNIMFLLEQHGFQMVSRRSRFSTTLELVVRKV